MMLVASGPAFGTSPSAPCLPFRRSIRVLALRPLREPADRHPANRAGVRSRQAGGPAPKSFPVPSGGSEAGSQFANPLFRVGEPSRTALSACLHPASFRSAEAVLPYAFEKAAVNRPTALRLSLHLRFAGPIRRSTTRVFRYCCGHLRRIVRFRNFRSLPGVYSCLRRWFRTLSMT